MKHIDPWVDELIDAAHRVGFVVGVAVTGLVWILCTLWGG